MRVSVVCMQELYIAISGNTSEELVSALTLIIMAG